MNVFFCYFGRLIRYIHVTYEKWRFYGAYDTVVTTKAGVLAMEKVIGNKCANTLHHLSVTASSRLRPGPIFDGINRPFPKLVTATFEGVKISSNLSRIDQWFPNVERLEFDDCAIANTAPIIRAHLPKMIDLRIMSCIDKKIVFTALDFKEIIATNPQLIHLDLSLMHRRRTIMNMNHRDDRFRVDWTFFRHIATNLPGLKTLLIGMSVDGSTQIDDPIIFDHVTHFRYFTDVTSLMAPNMYFKKLQSLELWTFFWNLSWSHFIVNNGRQLRVLTFVSDAVVVYLEDILAHLPKVETLTMTAGAKATDVIIRILNTYHTIKTLKFINLIAENLDNLLLITDKLNDEWDVTTEQDLVIFQRKMKSAEKTRE